MSDVPIEFCTRELAMTPPPNGANLPPSATRNKRKPEVLPGVNQAKVVRRSAVVRDGRESRMSSVRDDSEGELAEEVLEMATVPMRQSDGGRNFDNICAVPLARGHMFCQNPLSCVVHSVDAKRLVTRSKPFDDLLTMYFASRKSAPRNGAFRRPIVPHGVDQADQLVPEILSTGLFVHVLISQYS